MPAPRSRPTTSSPAYAARRLVAKLERKSLTTKTAPALTNGPFWYQQPTFHNRNRGTTWPLPPHLSVMTGKIRTSAPWLAQENALPPDLIPEAARAYPHEWLKNGRAAERLAADPALGDIVGSALRRLMLEGPEDADDHERNGPPWPIPPWRTASLVAAFGRGITTPYLERVAQLLQALCTTSGFPVEALAPRTDADAAQLVRGIRLFAGRKGRASRRDLGRRCRRLAHLHAGRRRGMGPEVLQKCPSYCWVPVRTATTHEAPTMSPWHRMASPAASPTSYAVASSPRSAA